jgi:hypothetical protein
MSNGSPHAQQRPVLPTTPPPTPVLHPEIRSIVKLNLAHTRKVYYSGPLVRHIEKLPDGRPPHIDEGWTEVWARLSGTTLNIWDMKQIEEANRQGTEVPPTYVNVNDAVRIIDTDLSARQPLTRMCCDDNSLSMCSARSPSQPHHRGDLVMSSPSIPQGPTFYCSLVPVLPLSCPGLLRFDSPPGRSPVWMRFTLRI